jgi:hypothetical protein
LVAIRGRREFDVLGTCRPKYTFLRVHDLAPPVVRQDVAAPAGKIIRDELEAATPLVRWLCEHVGRSLHSA